MRFIDYANSSIFASPDRGPLRFGTLPGFDPEILWDFTRTDAVLPGFSLTRATTGTYVAQDGSIQTAAINGPRYDWTGGVRALLVEPSATNLALNSGDMSGWTDPSSNTVITRPVEANPFGTAAVSVFTKTLPDNNPGARLTSSSVVSGETYSLWAIAKKGATNFVQVVGAGVAFGLNVWATFDLNAGTYGSVGTAVIGAPSITPLSGGWYICGIRGAATATTSGNVFAVALASSVNAARAENLSGTYSVKLCHAQIEQSTRTSAIVTGASAVTRAADTLASLSMSAIWAAAGSVQGTIVVDVEAGVPNAPVHVGLVEIGPYGNNALTIPHRSAGADICYLFVGNGAGVQSMQIVSTMRGRQRIAVSYANGAQPMVSRNGGAVQTHPLVYAHNPANTALQNLFGGFNGRVRSLAVYRNAASAAQLRQMSVAA